MAGISKKKIKKGEKVIIKYTITYRDIAGKQHTSGLYDTLKEAKKHLGKFEKVYTANNSVTLGKLIAAFMKNFKITGAKNTIQAYQSYIDNHLLDLLEIKYKKITPLDCQYFFNQLTVKTSRWTAHNVLIFCKGVINFCKEKRILSDENVFLRVKNIKRPKANLNHLTIKEALFVLEECKRSYPKYFLLLFYILGGGLRIGEAIALNRSDFTKTDLGGEVRICKQFTANELKFMTKTDSSNRTAYIFKLLADSTEEHIKNLPPGELLFPNEAGNYLNPNNLRKRFWKPLLKLCGITKRVRLHDLRGSYIDTVISQGMSGKFAQNNVGHSEYGITYNTYAKNTTDGIELALMKLNELFSQKCENNVRINENPPNKKIIPFPKKQLGKGF